MSTAADLLAACLADPAADLPRLLYADALDDAGDEGYAAFVRGQVAVARSAPWEPPAVFARRRRPALVTGEPFRDRLPPTGRGYLEWPAEPFRRGLGGAVAVRQLGDLLDGGGHLFAAAPVCELHLPTAPRWDDWKALAAKPWLARVRTLRFTGLALPIEAVRVLGEVPGGVTEVGFQQAASPAAAELFGGLARSPLGHQLTALHLRNGYATDLEELFDELEGGRLRAERLSLVMMGLTPRTAARLAAGPLLERVHALDLSHCGGLGDSGFQSLLPAGRAARLRSLTLTRTGLGDGAVRWACWAESLSGLKHLDLADNPLGPDGLRPFARESPPAGLRSLGLSRCLVTDAGVKALTASRVWPNLVELDLRFNQIGDGAARHLLAADGPSDLTALLLGANPIGERMRAGLRAKYGEAVLLDDD